MLHAIRWVGEAWKNVKVITIKKKCSVNVECYARTSLLYNTAQTDPFADNDEENDCEVDEQDLSELILEKWFPLRGELQLLFRPY